MTLPITYLDTELRSVVDIRHGPHRYAAAAEGLIVTYADGDGEPKIWSRAEGEPMPEDLKRQLKEIVEKKRYVVMHNGMDFDSIVLREGCFGEVIDIPASQIIDSMANGYLHGLPGALADQCAVFRLGEDQAKDKEGKFLINRFCRPAPKNHKVDWYTYQTSPEQWARFKHYALMDIVAMRECYKRQPKWNMTKKERSIQLLDARINRRGICIDMDLVRGARESWERAKAIYARRVASATGGAVQSATQRDALLMFFRNVLHVDIEKLTKSEVEKRLRDADLPEDAAELLSLRQMTARNSSAKYDAIADYVSADGRLRWTLKYAGAARTGRWAGRGPQFQNLARPTMKQDEIERAIDAIKGGYVEAFYDDVGDVLSNCLRGVIVSPEGKKLVVADFSNIEGRGLAWLAGEAPKIEAFNEYDTLLDVDGGWVTPDALKTGEHAVLAVDKKGENIHRGHDLYKVMYGKAFNVDPGKVTKQQRQIGKVMELALGYGGGAGAFASFAVLYGVDLHELADEIRQTAPRVLWDKSESSYETFFKPRGLAKGFDREVFVACDTIKRMWRAANPKIVQFWHAVGDAISAALLSPGVYAAGEHVTVEKRGAYLLIRLPSGRYLTYPSPRIGTGEVGEESGDFSYMGMVQYKHKWARIHSHAAKFVENITQAVARDVLAEAMLRLEDAGYQTVLTIHDEAITEAPDNDKYSFAEMSRIMSIVPSWAKGFPLAAAGYESHRYRKD